MAEKFVVYVANEDLLFSLLAKYFLSAATFHRNKKHLMTNDAGRTAWIPTTHLLTR